MELINYILVGLAVILAIVSYLFIRKKEPAKEPEHTSSANVPDELKKLPDNPFSEHLMEVRLDQPFETGIRFGLGFMLVMAIFYVLLLLLQKILG